MKRIAFFLLVAVLAQTINAQNVGIGTSTPNAKALLDLSSTTKGLLIPSMTSSQRTHITSPPNGLMVYDTDENQFYHFDGNGSTWRKILNSTYWNQSTTRNWVYNSTDSVGVGDPSPQERLDVNGNIRTNSSLLIDDAAGIVTMQNLGVDKVFMQLSGENLRVGTFSSNNSGKFVVRTNGDDRFWVDSAGNVAIGTTYKVANGYKMSVNGKIMCEEVRVQMDATWPDYVFEKQYPLMPLETLRQYIETNKHLPGILPASAVQANGIALGDMNKKLLEKVEELTLYILLLKKEIDQVKANNSSK